MNIRADVVVAGAGISGLAAAYRAQQSGATVLILEQADRVGGVMQTTHDDGYLVEAGPTSMSASASAMALLTEIGLERDVIVPPKSAARRYVVRDGRMHALPGSPPALVSSKLLTLRGKMRLLAEPFIPRPTAIADNESVADIVRRRFGQEVLDYVIDPFISGVCAGDPERLSSQHVLRIIGELEREYGSVLKGAIKRSRKRARASTGKHEGHIVSFRRGMQQLPDALHRSLHRSCMYNARLTSVRAGNDRIDLECHVNGTPQTIIADTFVCALPAHALKAVEWSGVAHHNVDLLGAVKYAPIATVALGMNRADVAHPLDGFGVLVPSVEKRGILGALFNSSMFEARAPDGRVLVTAFVGGARMSRAGSGSGPEPEFTRQSCTRVAERELTQLLGFHAPVAWSRSTVWAQGIPQLEVGHQQVLAAAAAIENQVPRAFFTGSYLSGAAIPDCLAHGMHAGARAAARATHRSHPNGNILAEPKAVAL